MFTLNKAVGILILQLALCVCQVSASPVLTNEHIGELTLTSLNMENYSSVPENIFLASKSTNPILTNISLEYNNQLECIDFAKSTGGVGEVYIGGLYPTTDFNISIVVGMDRDDYRSMTYIHLNQMYVGIERMKNDDYIVYSYWKNDAEKLESSSFTIPSELVSDNKIQLNFIGNSTSKTNKVKYSESLYAETAYENKECRDSPYTFLVTPVLYIESYLVGSECTTHIYSISQSIPRNVVTVFGSNETFPFGLDYPRSYLTQNGTEYMRKYGQVGTVWADVEYLDDSDTVKYTQKLLNNKWELGIHFSKSLSTLPYEDACDLMDHEYEMITTKIGQSPTSWCSLANNDNISHAVYAYNKYGMLWRNGRSGVSFISSVGNIHNGTWDWWKNGSNASVNYPAFTHEIDVEPAIGYSLDYSKFLIFSDKYNQSNMKVRGFYEYYMKNINQKDATVSIIERDDDHMTFTVDTNGYPCTVNAKNGLESVVTYQNGSELPYTTETDGSLTFTVYDNENYTIISEMPDSASEVDGNTERWSDLIAQILQYLEKY